MLEVAAGFFPSFPEAEGATGWSFAKIWAYTLALIEAGAMFCLFFGIIGIVAGIYTLKFQEDKAPKPEEILNGDTPS